MIPWVVYPSTSSMMACCYPFTGFVGCSGDILQVGGLLVHVDPPLKIDDELDVCIPGVMSNTELIAYAGSAVLDGLLME